MVEKDELSWTELQILFKELEALTIESLPQTQNTQPSQPLTNKKETQVSKTMSHHVNNSLKNPELPNLIEALIKRSQERKNNIQRARLFNSNKIIRPAK